MSTTSASRSAPPRSASARSRRREARRASCIAISMIDLTTLEGADTPGKVRQLCAKAVCPDPTRPEIPSVAAVCVYPALVPVAREPCAAPACNVASVSTGFPSGQTSLEVKIEETREAVAAGADEIDMVISREAYLSGDDARVTREIEARQGGLRRRASEGDPRDRRARRPTRTCATRRARDRRRRRLHQDLDRQGQDRRHARRRARDARDRARPRLADRAGHRRQGRGRRRATPRRRCTCSCSSRRRWATSG